MSKKEKIGNITLYLDYYSGTDLYNEGDEAEEIVLNALKCGEDYLKVLSENNTWPVLYQLSPERQNIIAPMDIKRTDEVLEIGAGMGAVTGAIAKRCKHVDCIDLSKRRSIANAYRNKEYDNIDIYVGNFQDILLQKKYDVITLIGVFEYAQSFIKGDKPYELFLNQIAQLLKPGGLLYIAIENKLGLKYFAGSPEDHTGVIFKSIEGYSKLDPARTFTKSEITELLLNNGYESVYFYYPYPDYKLPSAIYSEDYLPDETLTISMKPSYNFWRDVYFDEDKANHNLIGTKEWEIFSNSFLIEAKKDLD
ncbi:class I SAM-dependent methyltransferase [Clostridiales bacterium COT073_COT-073]|nr:class I SAM-dependent methyltransferase [Clostridiales bacterium COT073_COT-073]